MSRFPRRFIDDSSMEDAGISLCPSIHYRPINPNDLDRLEQIHRDIFPIKYASIYLDFPMLVSCEKISKVLIFVLSGMSLSFSRVL